MGIAAPLGVSAAGLPNLGDQANAVVSGTFAAVKPGKPFAFRGPMNLAIWASYNDTLTTTHGSNNASVVTGTGIAPGTAVNSVNVPKGTTWATFAAPNGTLALPRYSYLATGLSVSAAAVTLPPGSNVNALLGATVTVPSNNEGVTLPAGTTVIAIAQVDVAPSLNSPGVQGIVELSAAPTAVPTINAPAWLEFALTNNAITTGVDANAIFTGDGITFSATLQVERSFDGGATWILANIGGAGVLAQYSAGTPVSLTFGEPEKNVLLRINCTVYASGTVNYRISQTGGAAESLAIGPLSNG